MHLTLLIMSYSTKHVHLNKLTNNALTYKTHRKTYKSKYNISMNKRCESIIKYKQQMDDIDAGYHYRMISNTKPIYRDIKLPYKVTYNWKYELHRVRNFNDWPKFIISTQATSLHISQLTNLPKEIGQLTHLTELYLSNNKLTHLPKEIRNLINLQCLQLDKNKLTHLPTEIGLLTNLIHLSADNNKILHLPKKLFTLTNLQTLHLHANWFHSFPPTILKLTKLTDITPRDKLKKLLSMLNHA